jgi:hypothetical protein
MSVTAPVPLRNLIAGDWLAGSGERLRGGGARL